MDEIQLLYDLLTISIISSSWADQIRQFNRPHMAPGVWFAHAWCSGSDVGKALR